MIDILVDDRKFSLSHHTLQNNPTFIITQLLNNELVVPPDQLTYIEKISNTMFRIDISPKLFETIVDELRMSNSEGVGQPYDTYMKTILYKVPPNWSGVTVQSLDVIKQENDNTKQPVTGVIPDQAGGWTVAPDQAGGWTVAPDQAGGWTVAPDQAGGCVDNEPFADNLRIFEKPTDNDNDDMRSNSIDLFVKDTNNIFANNSYDNTTNVHELGDTFTMTNSNTENTLNTVNDVSTTQVNYNDDYETKAELGLKKILSMHNT
jgi:hypothetical protein